MGRKNARNNRCTLSERNACIVRVSLHTGRTTEELSPFRDLCSLGRRNHVHDTGRRMVVPDHRRRNVQMNTDHRIHLVRWGCRHDSNRFLLEGHLPMPKKGNRCL